MVRRASFWTSILSLIVWTRGKLPIYNQVIIWEHLVRGFPNIYISGPKGQTIKNASFAITDINK